MIVTIKDVARAAGVSVATVSRVLNDTALVSDETRAAVQQAVKNLNYTPNSLGRNLRKSSTSIILVIIPTVEHDFYSKIITGMQGTAKALGYDLITSISNVDSLEEIKSLEMLYNRTVDAAVIFSSKMSCEEIHQISEKYNIAFCCETVEEADVLTVSVADRQASKDAVKVLIDKGHKKIGFVCAEFFVRSSLEREAGYIEALAESGIEFDKKLIYKTHYSFDCGKQAFNYFNSLDDKPTAIFAVSDLLAIGIVSQALSCGVNVGKDLAVIGFDNILLSEMYSPSISTVDQPSYKMGQLVIQKLINNISNEFKDKKHYIIPHRIVLRQSTGD